MFRFVFFGSAHTLYIRNLTASEAMQYLTVKRNIDPA